MKLSQHNRIIRSKYYLLKDDLAGVECDRCGADMLYEFEFELSKNPPPLSTVPVYCAVCNYKANKML